MFDDAVLWLWCFVDVYPAENDSLFDKANKWPALFSSCCCCDIYSSWSSETFASVAERWLSLQSSAVSLFTYRQIPIKLEEKQLILILYIFYVF